MRFGRVSMSKAKTKKALKFMEITSKKDLKILIDWIKFASNIQEYNPCHIRPLIIKESRYTFHRCIIEKRSVKVCYYITKSFVFFDCRSNYDFYTFLYWIRQSKSNLNQFIKWLKEVYES